MLLYLPFAFAPHIPVLSPCGLESISIKDTAPLYRYMCTHCIGLKKKGLAGNKCYTKHKCAAKTYPSVQENHPVC